MTEVYIVSGVHCTLTKEAFTEEITFATDYLLNAIRSEDNIESKILRFIHLTISGVVVFIFNDVGNNFPGDSFFSKE